MMNRREALLGAPAAAMAAATIHQKVTAPTTSRDRFTNLLAEPGAQHDIELWAGQHVINSGKHFAGIFPPKFASRLRAFICKESLARKLRGNDPWFDSCEVAALTKAGEPFHGPSGFRMAFSPDDPDLLEVVIRVYYWTPESVSNWFLYHLQTVGQMNLTVIRIAGQYFPVWTIAVNQTGLLSSVAREADQQAWLLQFRFPEFFEKE